MKKEREIAAEFEAVWSVYPRRVGKGAAQKAWKAARKVATPEEIVPALRAFAESTRGTEQRFIPHLATWLSQRRWEDDPGHAGSRPRTSAEDLAHLRTISAAEDVDRPFAPQLRIRQ